MRSITIEEVLAQEEVCIIDVRQNFAFQRESLPGAKNIPEEELFARLEELPKNQPVYLLCATGHKTEELARQLQEVGYDAWNISGGFEAYVKKELAGFLQEEKRARTKEIERSIIKKFRKSIWKKFTAAINAYDLIQDGDRIAVCISGGKDSMLMAKLFQELYRHGKQNFSLVFLVMDPGYDRANHERILENAEILDVPITVFHSSIYDIVAEDEKSPCYLCARMRRGHLYAKARELGCNKIALGHHFDDVIETIVMGMFYGAQVQTMMPKLPSTNFAGMELIRPLYLIREAEIIRWARYNSLYFIRCACRLTDNCNLSETGDAGSMRGEVKKIIRQMEEKNPYVAMNIFRSVENVNLNTVIAYKQDGVKHFFTENYSQRLK